MQMAPLTALLLALAYSPLRAMLYMRACDVLGLTCSWRQATRQAVLVAAVTMLSTLLAHWSLRLLHLKDRQQAAARLAKHL